MRYILLVLSIVFQEHSDELRVLKENDVYS